MVILPIMQYRYKANGGVGYNLPLHPHPVAVSLFKLYNNVLVPGVINDSGTT